MGRTLRALSLDVVAGALCGGLLAESVGEVRMRGAWWVALAAAVWSVYTGDHLLDALRSPGPLLAERHAFHRRHARFLVPALGFALLAGLGASLFLRAPVRHAGLFLTALVALYLLSAQNLALPRLPKEPSAALLYAAGIWMGPIILSDEPAFVLASAASLQALAAFLNLVCIGCFESEVDQSLGARSLARRFGADRVARAVMVSGAAGTLLAAALAIPSRGARSLAFAVLGVQVALPALMLFRRAWFGARERYRSVGDAVFLLGALPRLLG